MGPKRQKRQIGFDLQIVGDLVGLPPEPAIGTVYAVRGGAHDGATVEHTEHVGWLCDGEIWAWRQVVGWLTAADDVWFEVVKAPKRCAMPGCVQPVIGRAIYCKPAHQVAAGRLAGKWDMGH